MEEERRFIGPWSFPLPEWQKELPISSLPGGVLINLLIRSGTLPEGFRSPLRRADLAAIQERLKALLRIHPDAYFTDFVQVTMNQGLLAAEPLPPDEAFSSLLRSQGLDLPVEHEIFVHEAYVFQDYSLSLGQVDEAIHLFTPRMTEFVAFYDASGDWSSVMTGERDVSVITKDQR